jgi:hypothetical protein
MPNNWFGEPMNDSDLAELNQFLVYINNQTLIRFKEAQQHAYSLGLNRGFADIRNALGFKEINLPCQLIYLIKGMAEQAKAWQALSHLVDKPAPNLYVASNRLAREIEAARDKKT